MSIAIIAIALAPIVLPGYDLPGVSAPPYTPHPPIKIVGNSDFTPANGVVGGLGTATNPFLIEGWEIDGTTAHGVAITDTDAHFVLRDLYVHASAYTFNGIVLQNVSHCRVENVTIEDQLYGAWGQGVNDVSISGSRVTRSGYSGVFFRYGSNFTARDSTFEGSGVLNQLPNFFEWDGISMAFIQNVTIEGNIFQNNDDFGVDMYNVTDARNYDNTYDGNWGGAMHHGVRNLWVARNTVSNHAGYGLDMGWVKNATVEGNNITNALFGVIFFGILGDPILQNEEVVVRRNIASGCWIGMAIGNIVAPVVTDNFVLDSLNPAFTIESSEDGIFTGNVIDGSDWDGVILYLANRTRFERNSVTRAVNLGIRSLGSQNVTLVENRIAGNGVGVALEGSSGWLVHHNIFDANTLQATDDMGPVNQWDDGYPSGGNWWSDYGGVDLCSGPLQNICPDPDSIGDTPYIIDPDSRDRYPLWVPAQLPPHAVFNVTPPTGNISTNFAFDASASWDPNEPSSGLEVRWDWEDDGTWDTAWSTTKNANHTYLVPGIYDVRLIVRDATLKTNETTRRLTVINTPPVASFTVIPSVGDYLTNFTVDATLSSDMEDPPGMLEVRWDWENDGTWDTAWSTTKTANHTYLVPGVYDVRLIVRDTTLDTDETTRRLTVFNTPPEARFTVTPSVGGIATNFTVDATLSSDMQDPPGSLGVRWDWEDDGAWDTAWSTAKTANHTYPVTGSKVIRLEVRDSLGLLNSTTQTVQVLPGPSTTLLIGRPNYTAANTYVNLSTLFDLSAVDNSGMGILRTMYRVDGGTWTDYGITGPFRMTAEGLSLIEWYSEDVVGNIEAVKSMTVSVDDTPPATSLTVGDPKYLSAPTFVTSSTPLTLQSIDGGPYPVGLSVLEYRIDSGAWSNYSIPVTLGGQGAHTFTFRSSDRLGNTELETVVGFVVDNSPPATTLHIGDPCCQAAVLYVTSATPMNLTASDSGYPASGLRLLEYRLWSGTQWSGWTEYTQNVTLGAGLGLRFAEYRAFDMLNNTGGIGNVTVFIDDVPPQTILIPVSGTFSPNTNFTLLASDQGSGVARTEYRIDRGNWTLYTGPFNLSLGNHSLEYRSVDCLGNSEPPGSLAVEVREPPPPTPPPPSNPPPESSDLKPVIAAIFAVVLAIVGALIARRSPLDGGPLRTWVVHFSPFVITEASTGVLSALTGALRIPPLLGAGTVVDSAIVVLSLAYMFRFYRKYARPEVLETKTSEPGTDSPPPLAEPPTE